MSGNNNSKIIPFKAPRKKPNATSTPRINEYGEVGIDKGSTDSNRVSGIQRFFYTMVALLIILSVFLSVF